MTTKLHTENSKGKAPKARPSKKAGTYGYRPGKRIPGAKPTNAPGDLMPEKNSAEAMEITSTATFDLWVIFTGFSDKPEGQMTPLQKMEMVDQGVTKKNLESLKEKAKLDYDELAKLLSVGRATLINKKGDAKFSPSLSEKIVGLADLYSYGYEVFEDNERFNQWMLRPNRALGGKAPYDLIHNQFGREEVRNVIGRIEYGVYS